MNPSKILKLAGDLLVMSFGTLLYCLAWESFMIPNNIASGGLTGLCTIIEFATNGAIPVAYSFIVLNVILISIGLLILGGGFGFKTIYCILLSTFLFWILPRFEILKAIEGNPLFVSEKILIPIIGGVMEAIGIFLIFKKDGSTGGTDVIALVMNKFWPISPGKVYLILDLFIIASILLLPGYTFQDMLYGYIAMITFSFGVDYLLLGSKSTMQVLIFSNHNNEIADFIISKMDRGVTLLKSVGWFTKKEKDVLLVIVRKTQLSYLTKAVKHIDKTAFMSISPASTVYGEGFDEIKTGVSRKKDVVKGSINQ